MMKMLRGTFHHLPLVCLSLVFCLIYAGSALAQEDPICPGDDGFDAWVAANHVDLESIPDRLPLHSVNWELTPFYPEAGTYLEMVEDQESADGLQHYSLVEDFNFFGVPVDFDYQEIQPPHFFLPLGWAERDMISLEWTAPGNTELVRAPFNRSGLAYIPDPSPLAAPGDTLYVGPHITVYGVYNGHRDQVIELNWRFGETFIGELDDVIYSYFETGGEPDSVLAWSASDSLMALGLAELPVGETMTFTSEIDWGEKFSPDPEFILAPEDLRQFGTISFQVTYRRDEADVYTLLDSNIDCIHPIGRGLWVSISPGALTQEYTAQIVMENFEGYNVWRRIIGSADPWANIWSISYNTEADKFYWWWIDGIYQPGAGWDENQGTLDGYLLASLTPIFGQTDQRVFLDFDVHNGFTYEYVVTTFDRGFRPLSGGGESDHYMVNNLTLTEMGEHAQRVVLNLPASEKLERNIYAVPNPLRTGKSARENPNYHNFPGDVVRFVGMTANATLKVYTLAGDLVFEFHHNDPDNSNIVWDTRNQAGELVGSGVYVFRAEGVGGEEEYGRLCIIR